MPERSAHGLIPLVHHRGDGPTFINPENIVHVGPWQVGQSGGAVLRLADSTNFRTDTPVADVLAMIAAAS